MWSNQYGWRINTINWKQNKKRKTKISEFRNIAKTNAIEECFTTFYQLFFVFLKIAYVYCNVNYENRHKNYAQMSTCSRMWQSGADNDCLCFAKYNWFSCLYDLMRSLLIFISLRAFSSHLPFGYWWMSSEKNE